MFFVLKKVMLHITLCNQMFDLMHTPYLLGRVKSLDIEIVQISIIRLSLVT